MKNAANSVGALLEVTEKPETLTFARAGSQAEYAMCTDIWLQASIVGHPFIEKDFWKGKQQSMTEQHLPASNVLLAYDEGVPVGFAATCGNTLAALFVLPSRWRNGIGRKLLNRLFAEHQKLELAVYQKNQRGVTFYTRMGFKPVRQQVCPHTGEAETVMRWERA